MPAYYNEHDPFAAAWLRELIKAGYIAPGEVDERSIEDVVPTDLVGFTQCHFFAGIGVWSYALRLAGWPDNRPVWTGSCPCQPFSSAGQGAGFADERHLWPALFHLISQCRPDVFFGEQVASKHGLIWFDLVYADLEAAGYACGAVDTCAAGFGAPHIRQRLYWVADAKRQGLEGQPGGGSGGVRQEREVPQPHRPAGAGCVSVRLGHAELLRRDKGKCGDEGRQAGTGCEPGHEPAGSGYAMRPGPTNGQWRDADLLFCRDGKWRPVESGTFPLAHGAPARVVRLRGYGNGLVAPQAAAFIRAYCTVRAEARELPLLEAMG